MATLDPRTSVFRPDLAAASLRDRVDALHYVEPTPMQVIHPVIDLTASPEQEGELASQLLFGEAFDVYEFQNGWAWGQSGSDNYVGYVRANALSSQIGGKRKRVTQPSHIYKAPDFKSRIIHELPLNALVSVHGIADGFAQTEHGFVPSQHLTTAPSDFVTVAESLMGTPYLWGGRSNHGLDCSALLQLSLMSTGQSSPRDSDMQLEQLGQILPEDEESMRGDLIFWKGHVGIMTDPHTLLHANIHHMAVASEPLVHASTRIASTATGRILARKRL